MSDQASKREKPWWIFQGNNTRHDAIENLPDPPPWRDFSDEARKSRGKEYQASEKEIELVNAALYLRRPLLITGRAGTGKSSLAHAVARELDLGEVLVWPITSRTTLEEGLYRYDAIGRLQATSLFKEGGDHQASLPPDIGHFLQLGPLGTAFVDSPMKNQNGKSRPRVLLIDEIDKSDVDFPNNLLHLFEEGTFEIQELSRLPEEQVAVTIRTHDGCQTDIQRGKVLCTNFPLVFMTSNGERSFSPAFLRRCLRLETQEPDNETLQKIVWSHLEEASKHSELVKKMIDDFIVQRDRRDVTLATDQLLNAVFLALGERVSPMKRDLLKDALFRSLSEE